MSDLSKLVLYRHFHNVSDELRSTCWTREITSWYVNRAANLFPTYYSCIYHTGEWLLVLAAAGGVGMAAIQIGKGANRSAPHQSPDNVIILTLGVFHTALGARVIACASPSKLDVARTIGGADFVVDYTKDGWQKEVLKITGGRGVDLVYDPVGRIKGASCSP